MRGRPIFGNTTPRFFDATEMIPKVIHVATSAHPVGAASGRTEGATGGRSGEGDGNADGVGSGVGLAIVEREDAVGAAREGVQERARARKKAQNVKRGGCE